MRTRKPLMIKLAVGVALLGSALITIRSAGSSSVNTVRATWRNRRAEVEQASSAVFASAACVQQGHYYLGTKENGIFVFSFVYFLRKVSGKRRL